MSVCLCVGTPGSIPRFVCAGLDAGRHQLLLCDWSQRIQLSWYPEPRVVRWVYILHDGAGATRYV